MKWTAALTIVALAAGLNAQVKPTPAKPAPAKAAPVAAAKPAPAKPAPIKPALTKPEPAKASAKPVEKHHAKATPAVKERHESKKAARHASQKSPAKAPAAAKKPAPGNDAAKSDSGVNPRMVAHSGRDPFTSPIVEHRVVQKPCYGGGAKCMASGEINLQGVVRMSDGNIAMVDNGNGKIYFLRVNDPVLNGVVVKITGSSILIRERVIDQWGKPKVVEVERRVAAIE